MALIEAQRMELRDRFARMQEKHDFKPGDLVRQKRGLSVLATADHQLMFRCYVDLENPIHMMRLEDEIRSRNVDPDIDCFVAAISDNGCCLVTFIIPSNTLELDPEAVL